MQTNTHNHSRTDLPSHPFPIEQLDDLISPFLVTPRQQINLAKDYDPGFKASYLKKSKAKGQLKAGIESLAKYQYLLYAQNTHSFLRSIW